MFRPDAVPAMRISNVDCVPKRLDRHVDAAAVRQAHDLLDGIDLFEIDAMVGARRRDTSSRPGNPVHRR